MTHLAARLFVGAAAIATVVALASCTSGDSPPESMPSTSETPGDSMAPSPEGSSPLQDPTSGDPGPTATPSDDPWKNYGVDMVRCLTQEGWNVTATGDGGFQTVDGIPNEQLDQYKADREECMADLGYDDIPAPSYSREEAEALYDELLDVADCVRDLGYTVPDAPSRQAFVEDLVSNPIPSWHPYDTVHESGGGSDVQKVETECPTP